MKEDTEIVVRDDVGVSSVNKISVKSLEATMKQEAEKRALMTRFISQHMKEGVDFGTIRIGGRDSKPSLFKPGSEKFLSLFKLTARFERDNETWEMAGSEKGVFAYKCLVYATNGNIVGEGRGVSKLTEKTNWTINNAVKIAEKRAQIDAVLRTGALSDFFTQDLEDMAQEEKEPMKPYRVERTMAPAEDEAGGNTEAEHVRGEVEDMQREGIKDLMRELKQPLSKKAIKELTKMDYEPNNYDAIYKYLKKLADKEIPF